jgi:adenosylcobinamide-GDP ribazoletransferase
MHKVVTESRAAIGLLTRIPVASRELERPGAAAFPLVGAAIGAIAALPYVVLAWPAREPVLGALAAVAVMVVLTGAIHLDGLADTADALLARDAAAAERARKDPAVGPGGVVAIFLAVATETAALASIGSSADALTAASTLVVAGGLARAAPVFLARSTRGDGGREGIGSWFASQVASRELAVAALTAAALIAVLAIVTTPVVAVAELAGAALGVTLAWAVVARRGGLDGDAFGAAVELTLVATLAAVAVAA